MEVEIKKGDKTRKKEFEGSLDFGRPIKVKADARSPGETASVLNRKFPVEIQKFSNPENPPPGR